MVIVLFMKVIQTDSSSLKCTDKLIGIPRVYSRSIPIHLDLFTVLLCPYYYFPISAVFTELSSEMVKICDAKNCSLNDQ